MSRYTLEPGRVVAIDGKEAFAIQRLTMNPAGLGPAELDKVARQIVRLLNEEESKPDTAPEQAGPRRDVYADAAIKAGWQHGGDNGGFWYDGNEFESWKAAASADYAATYATARELCESEGIEV